MNHIMEKPNIVIAKAFEKFKQADFKFMLDIKTLIHKTSVDPKLLELKICSRNSQMERAPDEYCPLFIELTKTFGLLFTEAKSKL